MTNFKLKLQINRFLFFLAIFFSRTIFSADLGSSVWGGIGEGAHGDNGGLIVGVNQKARIISGYYKTIDVTGNGINECTFYFTGNFEAENPVSIRIASAYPNFILEPEVVHGELMFQASREKPSAIIFLRKIPLSCEWLYDGLPSYRPPQSFKLKDGLLNEFERTGDWLGVNVIRSKRAYFHSQPDETKRKKAFIVTGDLIYIYDEKPDWYYVKFQGGKKETTGWIKKTDTIQLPE